MEGKKGKGRGRGRGQLSAPQSGTPSDVEGAMASLALTGTPSTKPKNVEEASSEETYVAAMRRPGVGTKGRQIKLVTNHFLVNIPDGLLIQHYDMSVCRKANSREKEKAEWTLIERLPKYLGALIYQKVVTSHTDVFPNRYTLAFDGNKNIFSKSPLPIDKSGKEFDVTVKKEEKNVDETFLVRIKHVAQIDVDVRNVFNRNMIERKSDSTLVLDVILKQTTMFDVGFLPFGRRIFYYPEAEERYPLGGGLVRFPGFWQSIRPVSGWKIMLNLDQANTAFVQDGPVLKLLEELGFRNPKVIPQNQFRRLITSLEKLVKGVKVSMTQRHDHRTAKCLGVSRLPASELTFPITVAGSNRQQGVITVENYFRKKHKDKEFVAPLQYPNLPCLQVGSPNKKNYVPLEFCIVKPGQRYPKKLDDRQTSQMLNYASQSAPVRRDKIQSDANFMKFNQDKYLTGFGFTVSLKMTDVTGRVLTPPVVEYKNQKITPKEGGWNMQNVNVIDGCTIRNFAAITTTDQIPDSQIEAFISGWVRAARAMGLRVKSDRASCIVRKLDPVGLQEGLKKLKKDIHDLDLVFIVLQGQNTDFYAFAKSGGDVKYGVNTQCIQVKNVANAKPAMLSNLCLKINGKLGGVNSKLFDTNKGEVKFFLREPILFLGADVNHPSPGEMDDPISCAAVVGNVDLYPSLYSARILLQHREEMKNGEATKRPQEWIGGMKDAVKMTIEHFVERNGQLPWRIVMYRDGVGETMFLQVLTKELTAIREACDDMAVRFPDLVKQMKGVKKYEPPITFIVVQKRHHTRLFCADAREGMGRGQNVPPGTTVDTTIVHPEEFDFYLCSHLGIQGTSRPAHYHVLHDDSDFSADDLQMLTYYLCHTYVRATRSVSIPPPCYYADLVAYRARKYLESRMSTSSSDSASVVSSSVSSKSPTLYDLQQYVNVDNTIVKKGMFFV